MYEFRLVDPNKMHVQRIAVVLSAILIFEVGGKWWTL